MLGIRFVKAPPNVHFLQYRGGRVVREGEGLSFFYYAPVSSLAAIPTASVDVPFIFNEVTADFQEITLQGQVTYRVTSPRKLARMLNFTLRADQRGYVSDDPEKLPQRVINQVQVLMRQQVQTLPLREALKSSEDLVAAVRKGLAGSELVEQLGIEVLALSLLAVKPNPETARALESDVREALLREADGAIYARRNAAVEQERAIRENELNTEIAVENKKRQIRETRIEADRALQERRQTMEREGLEGSIALEEQKKELVALAARNREVEADAQAYGLKAAMEAFRGVEPRTLQALASAGMNPAQLIAGAFLNLADNAERIGSLNIAPELLQELLSAGPAQQKT